MFKTRITEMLGIKYPISCGQVVGAIHEIKTARQVINGIVTEAEELLSRLNQMKEAL